MHLSQQCPKTEAEYTRQKFSWMRRRTGSGLCQNRSSPERAPGSGRSDLRRWQTPEQIRGIVEAMGERGCRNILVTRLGREAAEVLADAVPVDYHPLPKLAVAFPEERPGRGNIVVATGGTSDMPVAEEAALTAEAMGNRVTRLYDVGSAGLHRLLANLDPLMSARCVVAVAGMEGLSPQSSAVLWTVLLSPSLPVWDTAQVSAVCLPFCPC